MKEKSVLVVFGEAFPHERARRGPHYDVVVASEKLQQEVQMAGFTFVPIEPLVEAGSIYEASALLKELSYMKCVDGSRITKSFLYKGYELWWIHSENIFLYFCLPYTQYQKMLTYLASFHEVYLYRPPYANLFTYYLRAHGSTVRIVQGPRRRVVSLPVGIFLQMIITLLSVPVLFVRQRRVMVYIGDKFKSGKDYDFRMEHIYAGLRQKGIPFVEFIRSLESWRTVVRHAWVRRRPVVYTEAIIFAGRLAGFLSGEHRRAARVCDRYARAPVGDSADRFKILVATHYLRGIYSDVWAIRSMRWLLRVIGVKVAHITTASERSFPAVLGCKMQAIPTVGIQHGVTPRHYAVSEYMEGFDGAKTLSVDRYGLWSEGWRQYFLKNSRAYRPEQLYVSGSMRPLRVQDIDNSDLVPPREKGLINVLFISEQLAAPGEVMPYLSALIAEKEILVRLKIRPYRDGFEDWLQKNGPDILNKVEIIRGDIHEAVAASDVVIGSHSTAVLEALAQHKPFVFFQTKKWGDYFEIRPLDTEHQFFAENPHELLSLVRNSRTVPLEVLKKVREHFLGDPHKNGGRWVVDQIEELLYSKNRKSSLHT